MRADPGAVLVEIGLMRSALRVALAHLASLEDAIGADRADLSSPARAEFDNAMEMIHRSVCVLEALLPCWRRDLFDPVLRIHPDGYLGAAE